MSRVGRAPITLPSGVSLVVNSGMVTVKGSKGELTIPLVTHVSIDVEDNIASVKRASDSRPARANHGLMRALVSNMVKGVSAGFQKQLEIIGVGYRGEVKGSKLVMQLGFSHLIEYDIPTGISIAVDKKGVITVQGIDKQQVGQVAAVIRGFRPPDRYKGKGVRYVGEHISLKAGKSA